MASLPTRRCGRCRKLVQGRCQTCQRKSQRTYERNNPPDPFYWSAAWRGLRAWHLSQHPLCSDCKAAGRVKAAEEVHHTTKRADAPERELDPENLMSLCKACHSVRTRRGE